MAISISHDFKREAATHVLGRNVVIDSLSHRHRRCLAFAKTQLQAKVIAAVINLVRIRQMLQRMALGLPPRPKRPLSPFAQLRSHLAA
jgi:hypothetical protein